MNNELALNAEHVGQTPKEEKKVSIYSDFELTTRENIMRFRLIKLCSFSFHRAMLFDNFHCHFLTRDDGYQPADIDMFLNDV